MDEDVKFILDSTKESMEASIAHLQKALTKIRAGKASPMMLSTVMVDYYGSQTPLSQVSNINTPDARTLSVQPWEKNLLADIETAIMNANLGFNPMNNGEMVIINVPPLTEERRKQLVKQAKAEAEDAQYFGEPRFHKRQQAKCCPICKISRLRFGGNWFHKSGIGLVHHKHKYTNRFPKRSGFFMAKPNLQFFLSHK